MSGAKNESLGHVPSPHAFVAKGHNNLAQKICREIGVLLGNYICLYGLS